MKLLYFLLPLFGSAIGLALDSQPGNCVATCSPPKCSAGNALAACKCLNEREYACQAKCPEYKPRILHCPRLPKTKTTKVIPPKPTPTQCVCEDVFCILSFPEGCFCQNDAKKACFEKCGGEEPTYQDCSVPIDAVKARAPEPKPVPAPVVPPPKCECPQVFCIQSWPESCYCQNAAKERCYQQCGGKKPTLQVCPPQTTATLSTRTTTAKPKPSSTSKGPQPPKPTNQICGGGRGGALQECPAGQTCITNPFEPGSCGPACDQLGICVGEKLCGGFAGFECDTPGQICVDDPRDDCEPLNGGSDCGGLCAWPQ